MSKKECRKLVCVLALSLLMAMPGNGIAQMASASNSITTLSVEKNVKIEMFNSTLPLCSGILLCTSGI